MYWTVFSMWTLSSPVPWTDEEMAVEIGCGVEDREVVVAFCKVGGVHVALGVDGIVVAAIGDGGDGDAGAEAVGVGDGVEGEGATPAPSPPAETIFVEDWDIVRGHCPWR